MGVWGVQEAVGLSMGSWGVQEAVGLSMGRWVVQGAVGLSMGGAGGCGAEHGTWEHSGCCRAESLGGVGGCGAEHERVFGAHPGAWGCRGPEADPKGLAGGSVSFGWVWSR